MAFWQYTFWVLPKDRLIKKYGKIPQKIIEDDFNEVCWFEMFDQDSLVKKIDFLPLNQHWSENTLYWGDYDSDSIEIMTKGNLIIDVYIRIDLRKNYKFILNKIITLCADKLIIIDENLTVIPTELDQILRKVHLEIASKNNFFK